MRIRNICPGFWKNHLLGDLDFWERLLFQGLWCLADCKGRLEDVPRRIKAELFPYDDVDIDSGLDSLTNAGFIIRYDGRGQTNLAKDGKIWPPSDDPIKLIWIKNFVKHQAISGSERKRRSIYPACLQEEVSWKEKSVQGSVLERKIRPRKCLGLQNPSDVGRRTEDVGHGTEEKKASTAAGEGESGNKYAGWFEMFRAVHPDCERVGEMNFFALVRMYEEGTDINEALTKFGLHMADVAKIDVPLREFEKYLRHSARSDFAKKEKIAPETPVYQPPTMEETLAEVEREKAREVTT